MAAAADLGEERVGEREQVAGKLTGDSFCAKEGRKGGRRREGRSSERSLTEVDNGGRRSVLDFSRSRARPRSWRDGGASGRGRAARSATD